MNTAVTVVDMAATSSCLCTATATCRSVRPALPLLLVLLLAVGLTKAHPSSPTFRCFRPFDALDKFKPSSMRRGDNCRLDFADVHDAHANVFCHRDQPEDASYPTAGCEVTVSATLGVTEHLVELHRYADDVDVHPRFTLELRAVNQSRISYNGFDNRGYELCCDFLNETLAASCAWGDKGRRQVEHCVFLGSGARASVGALVTGQLRKPLHQVIAGPWEAKLTLLRGSTVVGKVVVPFRLDEWHIALATSHAGDSDAAAAVAVDESSPPSREGDAELRGDLVAVADAHPQ